MYYYLKFLCCNAISVCTDGSEKIYARKMEEWTWIVLWAYGELMVNPLSCVVFTIRNGGMMCRSSRIVGLIACRVIGAGRVTRRKFVGWCRIQWILIWRGKESVRQDGVGVEKPSAFTVKVLPIGKLVGVGNWKHLSVENLRRWRSWHCDWGTIIWCIVSLRLILSSLLTLTCKNAAESRIVSQFRMIVLLQVGPYAFWQVSYLESEVREFESTSKGAQIILALVWVEWEFKNLCTHFFLDSCFVNRALLALAIQRQSKLQNSSEELLWWWTWTDCCWKFASVCLTTNVRC